MRYDITLRIGDRFLRGTVYFYSELNVFSRPTLAIVSTTVKWYSNACDIVHSSGNTNMVVGEASQSSF